MRRLLLYAPHRQTDALIDSWSDEMTLRMVAEQTLARFEGEAKEE